MKRFWITTMFLLAAAVSFAQEAPPAKVWVAQVAEKEISENTALIGVLYFDKISHISAEVSGVVQEAKFRSGDRINKGDLLVRLNTDFLDMDKALEESKIRQAEVRIQKNDKNLKRYKALFKRKAASEIDYDNLYFLHQELLQEREILRKSLAKITLRREKCEITAPFDGIILEKNVDVGNWMIPGNMICRIGSADDLFIKVPMAEKLLKFAIKNEIVDVVISAYGKKLPGKIEGILPVADAKTKNVFLKIRIGDIRELPFAVAENMSATVFVPISTKKKLKIIPRDALIKFQGKDFIYAVKDGKAAIMPVHITAYMGTDAGVDNSNIVPGMLVVVDGNERLKPNQPVIVAGEK